MRFSFSDPYLTASCITRAITHYTELVTWPCVAMDDKQRTHVAYRHA